MAIQFGQRETGGPGSGSAKYNSIEGYQKGGIVVIGDGSEANVSFNSVRGVGSTAVIAQNGIQISDGASARVEFNIVSGNKYTGADFEGVGILVFNTSNVRIRGNLVYGNDDGIALFAEKDSEVSDVTVELNRSTNNSRDGISLVNVADSTIKLNDASHNGRDGINVQDSSKVSVFFNVAFGNDNDGIAFGANAIGNSIIGNLAFRNGNFDASDASTGGGTAGTGNEWRRNWFGDSDPDGLG